MNLLIFCPLEIIFLKSIDSSYSFALSQLFDSRKNILKKFLGSEYLYNVTMLQGSLENWEERYLEKSSVIINFQSSYRHAVDNSTFNGPCRKRVLGIFFQIYSTVSAQFSIRLPVLRMATLNSIKKTSILQAKVFFQTFPKKSTFSNLF